MTAASCKKIVNILMWLSGRAVKTQLQIVLFVATYPISVKNELLFLKKNI